MDIQSRKMTHIFSGPTKGQKLVPELNDRGMFVGLGVGGKEALSEYPVEILDHVWGRALEGRGVMGL